VGKLIRPAIHLLAAIPSVIYGFWGSLWSSLSCGPTSAVPAEHPVGVADSRLYDPADIISISEDSLKALPPSYKQGALALGATHWQTIWRVLIPAARSGIVASIILAWGERSENHGMIMILGNAVKLPSSFLDSARTLTTNIGIEMGYASGDHRQALFATGAVLFVIVMILNSMAIILSGGGSIESQPNALPDATHRQGARLGGRPDYDSRDDLDPFPGLERGAALPHAHIFCLVTQRHGRAEGFSPPSWEPSP